MTKAGYDENDDASWATRPRSTDNTASGEAKTGFVKGGDKGEFECGNCIHQTNGACHHPVMMAESKQPKNKNGTVKIERDDCCEFQKRPGDKTGSS